MAQLDGNTPVGPFALAESSSTRAARVALPPPRPTLPPPPVAGLRTVARLRGAFAESLPTLRLPKLPPRAWAPGDGDELAVAPPASDAVRSASGRPMSPAAMLRSGPRVVAPAGLRLRIDGVPMSIDPATTHGPSIRDFVEDTSEPEELDDSDLLDTDPTSPEDTLEGLIDPAATVAGSVDPGATLEGELVGTAPEWSAHGVPVVALASDLTPIVSLAAPAVPMPAVLVHTIVAPHAVVARSRAWAWAIALPVVALAVAAVTGSIGPMPATVARLTASFANVVVAPSVNAAPLAIATSPVIATRPVDVPPAIVEPLVVESPPAVAHTPIVPPSPIVETPAPIAEPAIRVAKHQRWRKRAPTKRAQARVPTVESKPAAPIVRSTSTASTDAKALLREAERAYAEGRFATALHFADRSRTKTPNPRATRIAALAACRVGQAKKAAAAFAALPLVQRNGVRTACRERGIDLP